MRKLHSHRRHFVPSGYGGLRSYYNVEWVDHTEDVAPELLPPSESVAELRTVALSHKNPFICGARAISGGSLES